MSDVTRILSKIESGDPSAAEQLLPLVYDELRKLAAARLAQEKPGQTLQATALVHEAFLRLVGPVAGRSVADESVGGESNSIPTADHRSPATDAWHSRGHFFAAAEPMRRILVEQVRQRAGIKRGGALRRLPLPEIATADSTDADDLLALDEALSRLAAADPQAATLLQLRYFGGLTMDGAAAALGISPRTAYITRGTMPAPGCGRTWAAGDSHG